MSRRELLFELLTPEGSKFSEQVFEVMLPTTLGQVAILPNHAPLVTIVTPGVISIRRHEADADNRLEHLAAAGGVAEISGHRVRVLADSAERAEDINELAVTAALNKARELKETAASGVALEIGRASCRERV